MAVRRPAATRLFRFGAHVTQLEMARAALKPGQRAAIGRLLAPAIFALPLLAHLIGAIRRR
jgi:hypothetical protein